jgi:hypothetical protein
MSEVVPFLPNTDKLQQVEDYVVYIREKKNLIIAICTFVLFISSALYYFKLKVHFRKGNGRMP